MAWARVQKQENLSTEMCSPLKAKRGGWGQKQLRTAGGASAGMTESVLFLHPHLKYYLVAFRVIARTWNVSLPFIFFPLIFLKQRHAYGKKKIQTIKTNRKRSLFYSLFPAAQYPLVWLTLIIRHWLEATSNPLLARTGLQWTARTLHAAGCPEGLG